MILPSQKQLFESVVETRSDTPDTFSAFTPCRIQAIGKRRDGGTKFWCIEHRADATAKYGVEAEHCRYARVPLPSPSETLILNEADYPGGVALWGAVPPVYDTTSHKLDRGVHVHARTNIGGTKQIDSTYRKVIYRPQKDGSRDLEINELDAIYYMVTSVFGLEMRYVECNRCGHPHLDRDWFSVHEHGKHLCAGCGKTFRDVTAAVGNPLARIAEQKGKATTVATTTSLNIRQKDFPAGLQIWGSNAAILWTAAHAESSGIHVHAYKTEGGDPDEDGTYNRVTIDGIELDADHIRTFMAQSALPHLKGRVVTATCAKCQLPHFDNGNHAFTPAGERKCTSCGGVVLSPIRVRNFISNPVVNQLKQLERHSANPRASADLGLIPETL